MCFLPLLTRSNDGNLTVWDDDSDTNDGHNAKIKSVWVMLTGIKNSNSIMIMMILW